MLLVNLTKDVVTKITKRKLNANGIPWFFNVRGRSKALALPTDGLSPGLLTDFLADFLTDFLESYSAVLR